MPGRWWITWLACGAALLGAATIPQAPAASAATKRCLGPAQLPNAFTLAGGRKLTLNQVRCAAGKRVVTGFAKRCFGAFSAQGICTFRTSRRWSCTSRLVAARTAAVTCHGGFGKLRFRLTFSRPAPHSGHAPTIARAAPAQAGPEQSCGLNTAVTSTPVPSAPAPHDTFELRTYGRVPQTRAAAIQAALVRHSVAPRLLTGLGVRPRGYPLRAPLFLVAGPNSGVTLPFCDGSPRDGAVVRTGRDVPSAAATAAHELFHIYASAVRLSGYSWFEESVAEWSVWRAGWYAPPVGPQSWDIELQNPQRPVDTLNPIHERFRYALWRFAQFLDDTGRGFIAADGSWPIARSTVSDATATQKLDAALRGQGTSLGQELAAFWGEHLKAAPQRPPQVKPSRQSGETVRVRAGTTSHRASACALCTSLDDFVLAPDVQRVEFEFEPPAEGYFWGLTAANESRRFEAGESVSFCVGAADGDDLLWPEHFPVSFTNGVLATGVTLAGTVKITATTGTEQCQGPRPNQACRVLRAAGAATVLGPLLLPTGARGVGGVKDGRPFLFCGWSGGHPQPPPPPRLPGAPPEPDGPPGIASVGSLEIDRWSSSKQLRAWIRRKHRVAGWRHVRFGDVAIFFERGDKIAFLQMAIGRLRVSVSVSGNGGSTSQVLRLAQGAVRELR
jgi:hypothetical protein